MVPARVARLPPDVLTCSPPSTSGRTRPAPRPAAREHVAEQVRDEQHAAAFHVTPQIVKGHPPELERARVGRLERGLAFRGRLLLVLVEHVLVAPRELLFQFEAIADREAPPSALGQRLDSSRRSEWQRSTTSSGTWYGEGPFRSACVKTQNAHFDRGQNATTLRARNQARGPRYRSRRVKSARRSATHSERAGGLTRHGAFRQITRGALYMDAARRRSRPLREAVTTLEDTRTDRPRVACGGVGARPDAHAARRLDDLPLMTPPSPAASGASRAPASRRRRRPIDNEDSHHKH